MEVFVSVERIGEDAFEAQLQKRARECSLPVDALRFAALDLLEIYLKTLTDDGELLVMDGDDIINTKIRYAEIDRGCGIKST